MSQSTLDDKQRMQINMSSLKSSSRIHVGCGDTDVTIKDAKVFVDFILNHNKQEDDVESSASSSTSTKQDKKTILCEDCGKTVDSKVEWYSKRFYDNHIYCKECQFKHQKSGAT